MRTFYIVVALFVLSACESIIKVEIPSGEQKIVAHGFFTPDSILAVNVSISSNIPVSLHTGAPVDQTSYVVVVTDDGGGADTLRYAAGLLGTDYRSVHDRRPHPGATYTLRAELPGYPSIEASSRLPDIVPMQHLDYSNGSGVSSLRFTIADPAGENYYRLELFQLVSDDSNAARNSSSVSPEYRQVLFRSADPSFRRSYGEVDNLERREDIDLDFFGHAVFSNALFAGTSHDVGIAFEPYPSEGFESRFLVILSSLSYDFFMYQHTLDRHQIDLDTSSPFETFPVPIYTNIKNGYGVFAGYVSDTYRFDLNGNEWEDQQQKVSQRAFRERSQ